MKISEKFTNSPIKIAFFAIAIITFLIVSAFLIADDVLSKEKDAKIGIEKGVDIVLSEANLEENQVSNLSATYTNKGSSPVYEVRFNTDSYNYSYVVSAHSGEILSYKKDQINEIATDSPTTTQMIGLEEAKDIALSNANLDASNVIFSKSKLDKDDSSYVYEIEFDYQDVSYEYEINAYTGEIRDKEIDD